MAYLIQGETLTAIANQTRRLAGASGALSPAQMATALSGVSPGGGNDNNSNSFSFSMGSDSLGLGDYINSNKLAALTAISMPAVTSIAEGAFGVCDNLVSAYFPACTSVGSEAFGSCSALETVTLNSACAIGGIAFCDVLAPESKTFRLYLRGNSMGTCDDTAFNLWEVTSCAYASPYDSELGAIPGLKIYVPASLLTDFKTTWAGGAFSNNIYALTD